MQNNNAQTELNNFFIFQVANKLHLDSLNDEQKKRALIARDAAKRSLIKNGTTPCIFRDFLSVISWHLVQDDHNENQQH